MKNVSESFKDKIKQPSRKFSIRVSIGGTDYTENHVETFKINSSIGNSDMISLGAFVADNLELSLINIEKYNFTSDVPIIIFVKLEDEEEICLGKFYVEFDSVTKTKMNTSVDAFGIAARLAETEYTTSLEFPATLSEIVNELETKYNLEFINKDVIHDIQYRSKPVGTVRAMISEIAQLCGTNVRERFEKLNVHQLEFVFFTETGEELTGDNYFSFKRLSDVPIKISKLYVEKNDTATVDGEEIKADDLAYGDDTGYAVKISNEHIESYEELETLYNKIFPYTFTPFECELQGMPHIEVGDLVTIREILNKKLSYDTKKVYNIKFNGIENVDAIFLNGVEMPDEILMNDISYIPETFVITDEEPLKLHIISHTLEYNGGFKSTFTSACPDESMLVVGSNGVRMEDIIKRTERTISALRVDNDRITMMVAELDGDITTMGTLYEQTAEQIQLTAERVEGMQAQFTLTADEINARVQDAEQGMSEISQTATEITHRVESAEQGISEIRQTVSEIDLSVDGGELISRINLSQDGVKIEGKNLDLSGLVTFTNLEEEGETVINAGNITTGFVSADRIQGGQFKATTDSESFLEITENGIKIQGEPNEAILDETNITELSARKFFEIDGRETGLNAWSGKWGIVLQGQAGTDASSGGLALGSKDRYDMLKLYPDSYENEQRAGKMIVEVPAVFVNGAYDKSFQDSNRYITKSGLVKELDGLEDLIAEKTDKEHLTKTELIKIIEEFEEEMEDGDTPLTKSDFASIFKDLILSFGKTNTSTSTFYLEDFMELENMTMTRFLGVGGSFPIIDDDTSFNGGKKLWVSGNVILYQQGLNGKPNVYRIDGVYVSYYFSRGYKISLGFVETGSSVTFYDNPNYYSGHKFYTINESSARAALYKAANQCTNNNSFSVYKPNLPSKYTS